jgi:hypothetical protein
LIDGHQNRLSGIFKLAHAASTGWPYFVKSFGFVALSVTV